MNYHDTSSLKKGQKVRIKSIDWYISGKDKDGLVSLLIVSFHKGMAKFCGKLVTVDLIGIATFSIQEDFGENIWTIEMIDNFNPLFYRRPKKDETGR